MDYILFGRVCRADEIATFWSRLSMVNPDEFDKSRLFKVGDASKESSYLTTTEDDGYPIVCLQDFDTLDDLLAQRHMFYYYSWYVVERILYKKDHKASAVMIGNHLEWGKPDKEQHQLYIISDFKR